MSVTVEAKMGALDLDKLEQCAKARGWRTARNAVVRLYRDVSRTMQLVVSPPNVGYDIGFNVTGEETETVFDSVMESSLMQLNEDYVTAQIEELQLEDSIIEKKRVGNNLVVVLAR